jgi:hypothetical protein
MIVFRTFCSAPAANDLSMSAKSSAVSAGTKQIDHKPDLIIVFRLF